ncbi:unnamed protein product [Debaryomyces tyrocola]|nr:unnamed protein product [Debaryomyces tyrocola]
MLKVKNMKFSNLILLVGTIAISKALDRNETLISASSGIGKVDGNETSVVDMLPSQLVDSTNLCISTLTLSTCACEPKESKSIDTPGEIPKYEGDEWDRYAEMPKVISTTLSPDYVLRTNFSTSRRSHHGSLDKNRGMSSVIATDSKHLENQAMTGSMSSEHGIQSLAFPSIYISSTRGHYYNTLTSVHHNVSFITGYHNISTSTSYHNISSTIHNASLSTYISTSEHTIIDDTSSTSSEEIVTTVAETETPTSQTQTLYHTTGTTQDLITNTAKSEHPTTDETTYADNEERTTSRTETEKLLVSSLIPLSIVSSTSNQSSISTAMKTLPHETVLETSYENEGSITTSMETKVTMEPSLDLYYPPTASQKTMSSHTSQINKPTILPEDNWSDYWSDENWSEEWPSEFWSDVFKETSKTDNHAGWKTHSTVERHSSSPSIKTNTNAGRKSHSELRSASKLQGIVHSTHASEGSFRILPTSQIPKQTSPSTENASHGHQTEEHHTAISHIPKQTSPSTENASHEHETEELHTEQQQLPPAEPTFSLSESYEHIHRTSESSTLTTAKSNVENHMSSTPENNVKPTTISSKSNAPKISHRKHSSYITEEGPTSFSIISPSISSSMSPSLSTHSTGRYQSGSTYNPKTSYYSMRSRLSTTASLSPGLSSSLPALSRTYPRKLSYSPIFTLKPAPSQLGLENTRQAKPLSQLNSEETETETETIYITLLSSTGTSKSMMISGYLKQSSSNESSTVSTNESMSSTLARPWHILRPEEETESNEHESSASSLSVYYLLLAPCFTFIVLL